MYMAPALKVTKIYASILDFVILLRFGSSRAYAIGCICWDNVNSLWSNDAL